MSQRQIFALVGAALLTLGAFTPLVSVPLIGNLNLFAYSGFAVLSLLLTVAIVIAGTLSPKVDALLPAGFGLALGIVAWAAGDFLWRRGPSGKEPTDAFTAAIAEAVAASIQPQWGWGILVVGVLALLVAMILPDTRAIAATPTSPLLVAGIAAMAAAGVICLLVLVTLLASPSAVPA